MGRHWARTRAGSQAGLPGQIDSVVLSFPVSDPVVQWSGTNLAGKTAYVQVWDHPNHLAGPVALGVCDAALGELTLEGANPGVGLWCAWVSLTESVLDDGVESDPVEIA